jgi:hypothetical protein
MHVLCRYQKLLRIITSTQFQPNAQTPIMDKDTNKPNYWVDALSNDQARVACFFIAPVL